MAPAGDRFADPPRNDPDDDSRPVGSTNSRLFLQLNRQIGWLARLDGNFLLDGPGEGLDRNQIVFAGRHVSDSELAVGAGDRVVGVVDHINPPLHPAMSVAVYSNGTWSGQFGRNVLALVRQRHIEGGALAIIAVGIVQHRILVDDIQRARGNYLHVGFEAALDIVEFGLLGRWRPRFPFGNPDQVDGRVLDALVWPDLDHGLLADAAAHFDILVRDDLAHPHGAVEHDLSLDRAAPRNRSRIVGLRRAGNHRRKGDDIYSRCRLDKFHQQRPPLESGGASPMAIDHEFRGAQNWNFLWPRSANLSGAVRER